MTTYRAAYLKGGVGTVLTNPEHSILPDADLLAEARAELTKAGIGDRWASIDEAMTEVEIGDWTE